MKVNKSIIYFLFLFQTVNSFSQTSSDSAKSNLPFKYFIGMNLFPAIVFVEPNFIAEVKVKKNVTVEFGYGYRFLGTFFSLTAEQPEGKDKQTLNLSNLRLVKQTGSVFKGGIKKYLLSKDDKHYRYKEIQLKYKSFNSISYCNLPEGSHGLTLELRELIEDKRQIFSITYGLGYKTKVNSLFYWDAFVRGGISYAKKRTHKIAFGTNGGCNQKEYPENTFENRNYFFPQIEAGLNFGWGR